MSSRLAAALAVLSLAAAPLRAQEAIRDQIARLFQFGACGRVLCLDGSINAANGHGDHYLPATVAQNAAMIGFIADAIGVSITNVPLSAASGGTTFTFENGLPVKTSESSGPIFSERAQTLGRGRLFVGANVTAASFKTIRGVPLANIQLSFPHQDVAPSGLGDPLLENDVIDVRVNLDVNLSVTSLFATYGVTDRIDVGVSLPVVRTSLNGRSVAQIIPFGQGTGNPPTAVHFFGGSPTNPQLRATASVDESTVKFGDAAVRAKVNLNRNTRGQFAILADARLPTGDRDELVGTGGTTVRALGIFSSRFRDFSPHLNAGYIYRDGEGQNSAFVTNVGFDQLVSPWATLAFDLLSQWEVGVSPLRLPQPATIERPFRRVIIPTNIPDRRDDIVDASLGFKLRMDSGVTGVANLLVPLNRGGIRPNVGWTLGLEYNF